eukprot:g1520.t1
MSSLIYEVALERKGNTNVNLKGGPVLKLIVATLRLALGSARPAASPPPASSVTIACPRLQVNIDLAATTSSCQRCSCHRLLLHKHKDRFWYKVLSTSALENSCFR